MSIDAVLTDDPKEVGAGRGRKPLAGSVPTYRLAIGAIALLAAAVVGLYVYSVVNPTFTDGWSLVGWHFFSGIDWNFGNDTYGALPLIIGTVLSSALAILIAGPIGVGSALAIVYLAPQRTRFVISTTVELLAFVPSIIYGLWGFFVIAPWIETTLQPWLLARFGNNFPNDTCGIGHCTYQQPGVGIGIICGAVVLSVMILPTVTAISRDVLAAVPNELVEGGLSVGATKAQVLRKVVLRSARPGIIGAITLAIGRALGETIALVFVCGNLYLLHPIPEGLNSTFATLATELAQNFGNGESGFGILCCLAVVLMVIVGSVNLGARLIVHRSMRRLQP